MRTKPLRSTIGANLTAGGRRSQNVDIECPSVFSGSDDTVRAFLAAGPVNLATMNLVELSRGYGPYILSADHNAFRFGRAPT